MKIPIPKTDRILEISLKKTVFSLINSTGDRVSDWFKIQLITQPIKGKTVKINLGEMEIAIALLPKTIDERFSLIDTYPWRIAVFKGDELQHTNASDNLTFAQAFVQAGIIKRRFLECDRVLMTPVIVNVKLTQSEIQEMVRNLTEWL